MRVRCSRKVRSLPEICGARLGFLAPCEYIQSTHFRLQWAHRPGARYALPAPCARCQLSHSRVLLLRCLLHKAACLAPGSARSERKPLWDSTSRAARAPVSRPDSPRGLHWLASALSRSQRRAARPTRRGPSCPAPRISYRVSATEVAKPECGEACAAQLVPGLVVAATAFHAPWRRRHARRATARPRAFFCAELLPCTRRKLARRLRQRRGRLCRLLTCCKTSARASS